MYICVYICTYFSVYIFTVCYQTQLFDIDVSTHYIDEETENLRGKVICPKSRLWDIRAEI